VTVARGTFRRVDNDRLTVAEVAQYLGLSETAVRGAIARGDLPATGWPQLVKRSEVEAYIRRSRIPRHGLPRAMNPYRR
jgi:excisionase family DNA binding protein